MLVCARAFGIPDSVDMTTILFTIVGILAAVLVLLLVVVCVLNLVRKNKLNKLNIDKSVLSDEELDKIIIENASIKESDNED